MTDIAPSSGKSQECTQVDNLIPGVDTNALQQEVSVTQERQEQCAALKERTFARQIATLNNEHIGETTLSDVKKNNTLDEGVIRFSDVLETAQEGNMPEALGMGLKWLFQDDETVGLGFTLDEDDKNAIYGREPSPFSVAQLSQIKKLNKASGSSWEDKLKYSVIQGHMEHALFQKGYVKKTDSPESPFIKHRSIKVSEDDAQCTIKELVQKNFTNGDEGAAIISAITENRVLGTLDITKKVPEGAYLYFSPEGYPIYVSAKSGENPDVDIFEEDESGEAGKFSDADPDSSASKIAFLTRNLQKGDILMLNEKDKKKGRVKKMILKPARAVQAEAGDEADFHSIHTAVYIGDGKIAHIRKRGLTTNELGKKTLSLDQVFNRYNGVSVSRMDLDADTRVAFADSARGFIEGATSYGSDRAIDTAQSAIANSVTEISTDTKSLICTDPLRLAAQKLKDNSETSEAEKAEFQKLEDSNMAKDIFKKFYSPYSFNVGVVDTEE